jgi:hypothetical protein
MARAEMLMTYDPRIRGARYQHACQQVGSLIMPLSDGAIRGRVFPAQTFGKLTGTFDIRNITPNMLVRWLGKPGEVYRSPKQPYTDQAPDSAIVLLTASLDSDLEEALVEACTQERGVRTRPKGVRWRTWMRGIVMWMQNEASA